MSEKRQPVYAAIDATNNVVTDEYSSTNRDLWGYENEEVCDADHYAGCI